MSKSTIEDKYQKKSHREHILDLPDTYIGSIKEISEKLFLLNNEGEMELRVCTFVPGLYKIIDEILVNSMDHSIRESSVTKIKVNINDDGQISVFNNGPGIPIEKHKEHNMYIPEMIFGNLLTSSNYNKNEKKIIGGKNGYGAKLANIFSKLFIVETVNDNKEYKQKWKENMTKVEKPKIKNCIKEDSTKITFLPDYSRFGMESITQDIIDLIKKRCYDISACTKKDISVSFNNKVIKTKTFDDYINLYIGNKKETKRIYTGNLNEMEKKSNNKKRIWEVVACLNPDPSSEFQQVSFVNGVWTIKGGKHVDDISNQIIRGLTEYIKNKSNKNAELNIKPGYIKNRLWIFLRATVVNPSFSSQTKEELVTPMSSFDYRFKLDNSFIEKLAKCGIMNEIIDDAEKKESNKIAKQTDGKKNNKIIGIPKYEHAHMAGTKESHKCTLILTEGDSAKTMAMSGLNVIGRKYYGIFPLRGKLLNVREATKKQLESNEEIMYLKKILGLQQDKEYTSTIELNYGSILTLTDQDVDGYHIKGLIMNFIETWWPSLIKLDNFITSMNTPIIKATKGKKTLPFYSINEYNKWKESEQGTHTYKIKYYKGLGTSTSKEAKEYFSNLEESLISYKYNSKTKKALALAFDKKNADKRKKWLMNYNPELANIDSERNTSLSYDKFINDIMIQFSYEDLHRSLACSMDGLKTSQRKVLFGCFKEDITKSSKVAEISGVIMSKTAYHHGDMSMTGTIIKMAQNFWSSNNINFLNPDGAFGSRNQGGEDSASPRYIQTMLEPLTFLLFNKKDFPLYEYLQEDGKKIEPKYYLPIIPTVLVNGVNGIGTGFSCKIPKYNPLDIINYIRKLLNNEEINKAKSKLVPWYRLFNGTIVKESTDKFISKGIWKKLNKKQIEITELPIGVWTENYKQFLESITIGYFESISKMKNKKLDKKEKSASVSKEFISDFKSNSTDHHVNFIITFPNENILSNLIKSEEIEKKLKLTQNINTSNMHLFDHNGIIKKYNSPEEIINDFYKIRLEYYEKRRDYLINDLNKQIELVSNKVRFIEEIINEDLIIFRKKKKEIEHLLIIRNYSQIDNNYNYLTSMPIYTFSYEKIEELKKLKEDKLYELELLYSKTYKDLWLDDLNEFEEKYEIWCKEQLLEIQ